MEDTKDRITGGDISALIDPKMNLKKAFAMIKKDYKTHDALLDQLGEAEGFVLKISGPAYSKQKEQDKESSSALFFKNNTPEHSYFLLVAQRNRNNHLAFGDWYDAYVEGVQSVIRIYEPDTNYQKMNKLGVGASKSNKLTSSFPESPIPEKFALDWLTSRGEVEFLVGYGVGYGKMADCIKDRSWDFSGRGGFTAKLEREDVIQCYKNSVRDAVEFAQNLERYDGFSGGSPSFESLVKNSQNVKLFNRDRYSVKNIPTKIYGFELKQMHI